MIKSLFFPRNRHYYGSNAFVNQHRQNSVTRNEKKRKKQTKLETRKDKNFTVLVNEEYKLIGWKKMANDDDDDDDFQVEK